jgi:hypothetical protein
MAGRVAQKLGVPFIYSIQDLFPDSLVTSGLSGEGSLLYRFGEKMEKKTHRSASKIIVLTETIRKILIGRGVDGEKLVTTTLGFKGGDRSRFKDVVYALPLSRTRGKKSVRVEFRGNKATSWVGGLFGLTMRRSEGALLDGETLGETAP